MYKYSVSRYDSTNSLVKLFDKGKMGELCIVHMKYIIENNSTLKNVAALLT